MLGALELPNKTSFRLQTWRLTNYPKAYMHPKNQIASPSENFRWALLDLYKCRIANWDNMHNSISFWQLLVD